MSARVFFVVLVALLPTTASASSESGTGFQLWHFVNLVILFGAIIYFGRTPVMTYLAERRGDIESELGAARKSLDEAESELADWKQKKERLASELDEIRRNVRTQAEAERDRLLEEARATAERIRRDAAAAVDQEVRLARESLRAETAELAVRLASELIERNVNDSDRTRLVDEFVSHVEQVASGDRRS